MVAATVLQLSDTHLTDEAGELLYGLDPDVRLATVLDAWRQHGEPADLVLLTGDDADAGSPAAYERLAVAVDSLGVPVMAIAGNHDDPPLVADRFGGDRSGRAEVSVEVGGWRIVGFDTSVPDHVDGAIDVGSVVDALDRLERMDRLERLGPRPTVVAVHHPPRSPSTHPWFQLAGADAFLSVLAERPHVHAVVSGHLHQPFELGGPSGIRLLGAPSTLEAIDHVGDRYEIPGTCPTGARVLRLGDDGSIETELLVA